MTALSSPLSVRITGILQRRPVIMQLLRFAAIGSLNAALDVVILNFMTKYLGITSDVDLGLLNVISTSLAIVQSYLWNRAWSFAENSGVSVFQNFVRLVLVGALGFTAFLAVILGAANYAHSSFFLLILVGLVIIELILWTAFSLRFGQKQGVGAQFTTFIVVSLIGSLINSVILVLASKHIAPYLETYVNADTIKNVAKMIAIGVSLIWNFVGYKLIVFRK